MKFKDWFIKQFGKRSLSETFLELEKNIKAISNHHMESIYLRTKEWDKLYNACLYVWNIKKDN